MRGTKLASRISRKSILGLIGWLLLVLIAAGTGAAASIGAESFYAELALPTWAPPGWVFGPVWTVLYVLMGVAAWLVWSGSNANAKRMPALIIFVAQLVVNALWSWLFFAWRLGGLAFLDAAVLLVAVTVMIPLFWHINRLAAVLLIPYFIWLAFASALNYAVWQMNPYVLG